MLVIYCSDSLLQRCPTLPFRCLPRQQSRGCQDWLTVVIRECTNSLVEPLDRGPSVTVREILGIFVSGNPGKMSR